MTGRIEMSILIKNMTMPETCEDCPLQHSEYLECKITGENTWDWENAEAKYKSVNCPLVEIPPHGRLIDAYELAIEILKLQKYRFSIEDPEIFVSRKAVMQAISDNPTVIEADVEQATVCSATDCEHNVDGVCKKNAKEVKE